ncbi:ATP-binding protein [Mesoterricola sediminis]|uniref:histidine kinase n=1 Tax=Mesoterricola sediminis TaxID=2927980 RepID=A0AA48GZ79_9BACT|nr:ATP-binding protein [Mesoterricola sediminis]BDU76757.1 hypothetical protein METESE_17150 [Mesoterricola sediminis]
MSGSNSFTKTLVRVLLAAALGSGAAAQEPEPPGMRPVKVFREAEGLPQMAIYALAADRGGHLWAGTMAGIARFDGHRWQSVEAPPNGYALMANANAMTGTSDGAMWVGTRFQGILEFKDGRCRVHNTATGLPLDNVNAVLERSRPDAQGRPVIYAATYGKGLAVFENGAWRQVPGDLPDGRLHCLFERDGEIWVGTHKGIWILGSTGWRPFEGNGDLPDAVVRSLAETRDAQGARTLWIGLERGGLCAVRDGRVTMLPLKARTGCESVRSLLPGPGGSLWVALFGGGLVRIDGDRWEILNTQAGFPTDHVRSLATTPGGPGGTTLWAGLDGKGVLRLHPGGWRRFELPWKKADQRIQCFAETRDPATGRSVLWMGHRALARLQDGGWKVYHPDPEDKADSVRALFAFPGGQDLHFGKGQDLVVFSNGRFRAWTAADGLPAGQIRVLTGVQDGAGHRQLYIGTSRGLAVWDGRSVRVLDPPPGDPECAVRALAVDGPRLWVGTDRGLACLEAGAWVRPPGLNGLPSVGVHAILPFPSRSGRGLLVGTFGSGLWVLEDADRTSPPQCFNTRNTPALRHDLIYDIVADGQGRYLVDGPRGVARLDPAGWAWDTFTVEDGLPGTECLKGALFRDAAGRVWIGTEDGPAWADPREMPPDRTPKALVLESATAGGAPIGPGAGLPHDVRDVIFSFRLLTGHRERDSLFRTRLAGLQDAPGEWSPEPAAHFTSLPSGAYTLEVWGRDYAGNETGPLRFSFRVARPWWNRPWAWVLYAAAAAAAVQGLLMLRTRLLADRNRDLEARVAEATDEIRRQQEEAEALNRELIQLNLEKNKLLGIAAHDLRSPLNTISLVSEGLVTGDLMDCPPDLQPWIRKISTSARHMTELIGAFLDVAALESGRLLPKPAAVPVAEVLEPLASLFQPRLDAKGQHLRIEAGEPGCRVLADPSHLRQILDNLLSNASKFSPAGADLGLGARRSGALVLFEVADQGPGLKDEDQAKLFRRFAKLSARPTAGEASSGLGLSIVKQLVDANHGRIWAENLPAGGCVFRVEMPAADFPERDGRG